MLLYRNVCKVKEWLKSIRQRWRKKKCAKRKASSIQKHCINFCCCLLLHLPPKMCVCFFLFTRRNIGMCCFIYPNMCTRINLIKRRMMERTTSILPTLFQIRQVCWRLSFKIHKWQLLKYYLPSTSNWTTKLVSLLYGGLSSAFLFIYLLIFSNFPLAQSISSLYAFATFFSSSLQRKLLFGFYWCSSRTYTTTHHAIVIVPVIVIIIENKTASVCVFVSKSGVFLLDKTYTLSNIYMYLLMLRFLHPHRW